MKDTQSNDTNHQSKYVPGVESAPNKQQPEYIVGIGASAGGLEALERFFSQVPNNTGAAYVVIQHLSPDFKNMMVEILGRKTSLPVLAAQDGMTIQPDHVYLNTPRHDLRIENGVIQLTPVDYTSQMPPHPINTFFESLASQKGTESISVVLSGTGTDGSLGSAAISAAGGLVITQDVESSLFPSMPQNASVQGPADMVMPPEEMPEAIIDFIQSDIRITKGDMKLLDFSLMTGENAFSYLLSMLQREYGIDYTQYKPQTLVRRVERRIALNHHPNLTSYIHVLQEDQEEMDALYRDVMVDVTSFFRDKEAFEILEKEVIPQIVSRKSDKESIRLWVAGCASGEEAYSLAILFLSEIDKQGKDTELKIFATDAHKNSISRAGTGVFSSDRVEEVPPHFIERYFVPISADEYQIRPQVRRTIVFAPHNLLVDAHFTNLDLISCRNVLIYLWTEAQTKVLQGFHQGLNTGGILFLGASEHLGSIDHDYQVLSRHWRIYSKIRRGINMYQNQPTTPRIHLPDNLFHRRGRAISQSWERGLLHTLVKSGFVVDDHGQLQQIYGPAEKYVNFKSGRVDLALTNIVISDLSTSVRTGLFRARKEKTTIKFSALPVNNGEDKVLLDLTISPFKADPLSEKSQIHYLISLENSTESQLAANTPADELSKEDLDHIRGLERELAFTKESLQTTIEEVETTNEELQSSNEELIAANEELQSTNEELSSVNEELFTVNAEYQDQNQQIKQSNDDMANLLSSSGIMVIFLDKELRLRIVTPSTYEVFGLLENDIGRPITHFSSFMEIGAELFLSLSNEALKGKERQTEITVKGDQKLIMKTFPYMADKQNIDGVILYFINVEDVENY